jgi:hypothetical protein
MTSMSSDLCAKQGLLAEMRSSIKDQFWRASPYSPCGNFAGLFALSLVRALWQAQHGKQSAAQDTVARTTWIGYDISLAAKQTTAVANYTEAAESLGTIAFIFIPCTLHPLSFNPHFDPSPVVISFAATVSGP